MYSSNKPTFTAPTTLPTFERRRSIPSLSVDVMEGAKNKTSR